MLEKIAAMLQEQLGTVDAGDITEETSFKEDLGADSLDLFELVMQCEEEYGIEFPSDDLENMKTVGDVVRFIKEQGIDA
ncbi:MAG: acyl carrier protein [Lachnospiraceae bacterium]|nr:acyl carrier protein [Lachnospiraceae bacterium]